MHRWDILSDLIQSNGYKNMAEIGVMKGRNIFEICSRCPDITVYAIDPWCGTDNYVHWSARQVQRHERLFSEVKAEFPQVKKIKAFSTDAAPLFEDQSLDLVFIDGDHSYEGCKSDIKAWLPKVKRGGIISGHDYGNTNKHGDRFEGVKRSVDEAFGDRVELYDDHVWVVRC